MVSEQLKKMKKLEHTLACAQFIVEVALIASKSRKDDRIALDILVILLNSLMTPPPETDLFYEAE